MQVDKKVQSEQLPELVDYKDYRKYLEDFYLHKKQSVRGYSYAVFSARADIKSPNYLKLVIDGKRNLSKRMSFKFAKGLGLDKQKTQEFVELVQFNQSLASEDRNNHLRSLVDLRVKDQIDRGELKRSAMDLVPDWLTWVIYEMVDQWGVDLNRLEAFRLIRRTIKPDDAKKALNKLLENGELIRDTETQEIMKARDVTKSREDIPVELVKKLQAELLGLGLESLYHDSPKDREFGALTISLTEEEFEGLKFELRQMRKRIKKDNAVQRAQVKGDRVYQLNLQLFPITDKVQDS